MHFYSAMRGGQHLQNQITALKGQVASLQARADASDQKLEILLAYISPASRPGEGPQVENISILTPEEVATIVTQLGSGSTDYRKHQEKTINFFAHRQNCHHRCSWTCLLLCVSAGQTTGYSAAIAVSELSGKSTTEGSTTNR